MDELARESMADELPPVFALLPEVFTIEQLRNAISQVAHRPEFEAESSSNFRRRIVEFVKYGVLAEVNEPDLTRQKGRPAMRYRFVPHAWRRWLETRTSEPTMREMHQMRSEIVASRVMPDAPAMMRGPESSIEASMEPMDESQAFSRPFASFARRPEDDARPASPARRMIGARRADSGPAQQLEPNVPEQPSDADRVKQLEQMVLQLAQRFDAERGKLDAVLRAVQQNAQKADEKPQ